MKAGADKAVRFTRKANAFTLVLPLSPRDADEAVATMNLAKTIVAERLKAGKAVNKQVVRLLEATEVSRGEGAALSVTVHVERLMRVVNADQKKPTDMHHDKWAHVGGTFYVERLMELLTAGETTMPAPDEALKLTYQTTIESVKTRGIAANPIDQFPAILNHFLGPDTVP